MKNYALVSVYDKSKLGFICKVFEKYKIKIISTGSTAKYIKQLGYACIEVSKLTKFKEILNGRVKTLHPKIHASLLFERKNKLHSNSFKKLKFPEINYVIVNFYPFDKLNFKNKAEATEMIDIGGPSLIRSAAKNYNSITAIINKKDYAKFVNELKKNNGYTTLSFRKKMALKAFKTTSLYDKKIYEWFSNKKDKKPGLKIKYGENPNQKAIYFSSTQYNNLEKANLSEQKLSYNNILDIDSAINCINEFKEPTSAIIKHNNPCGVASSKNINTAFYKSLKSDELSAFGGVLIINKKMTGILSKKINNFFFEVVIAKSFEKKAVSILLKNKKIKIIDYSKIKNNSKKEIRSIFGGYLVQEKNLSKIVTKKLKLVSKVKANKVSIQDIIFALKVCKHLKSNSIVLAKNKQTIGIGAGQMSRVDSTKIAIIKLNKFNKKLSKFVAASDAFFPFNDSIGLLCKRGCVSIVQPKGSVNDKNMISFSNKNKMSLYFTTERFFKH